MSTVQEAKAVYDQVGSVPKQDISFARVIQPLLDVERDSSTRGVALQLPAMVATDKNIRDASNESEKQLDEFSVEMSMRKDVFDNIVAFRYCVISKKRGPKKLFLRKLIFPGPGTDQSKLEFNCFILSLNHQRDSRGQRAV